MKQSYELAQKIWNFATGDYPILAAQDATEQSVALAYGLVRMQSVGNDSSIRITVTADNYLEYVADFATLDVNLLAPKYR